MRYGYRRAHILQLREGWPIDMKRTGELYNELDLQLRNTLSLPDVTPRK